MAPPTTAAIRKRVMDEFLGSRLLDNNLRGYWCEAMVAEAIGPKCEVVSGGWHPWDLQIGPDKAVFPERIRIQVKNSARVQTWNLKSEKLSETIFQLTYRKRHFYFERDRPEVPCEAQGFMCDLFVLCHHPVQDFKVADHRDPQQWEFFLLPVVGPNSAVTPAEISWAKNKLERTGKPSSTQRRPSTMARGIRGRPALDPIAIERLDFTAIWQAVSDG